eukprot:6834166-Karenia_brevis.AAC.1
MGSGSVRRHCALWYAAGVCSTRRAGWACLGTWFFSARPSQLWGRMHGGGTGGPRTMRCGGEAAPEPA